MRYLLVPVLALLASPAFAQTSSPATPTQLEILVLPALGDPATVAPIVTSTTAISVASSLCNLPPTPGTPPASVTNPTWVEVTDPFTAGRVCRVAMPDTIPDGTAYRTVAVFIAASCTTGTPPTPATNCRTTRSAVGAPPFSVVSARPAPPAPTGVRNIP